MQEHLLCGFDFVVAPVVQPGYEQPALQLQEGVAIEPRIRKELMLASASWGGQIVGKTSSWIDPDSEDPQTAAKGAQALLQELNWAAFLGLQAVLIPSPAHPAAAFNFAQILNQPFFLTIFAAQPLSFTSFETQLTQGLMCSAGVALEVPAELPPGNAVNRWLAQPLKALLLPTSVFGTNKRGYPVLPKGHQDLLAKAYKHNIQAPLQPLQDNLESQTYETFEKDVTKYNCYQEAVRRALLDRMPAEAADSTVTILMVVGAGGEPQRE
eukprot:gene12234-12372_t